MLECQSCGRTFAGPQGLAGHESRSEICAHSDDVIELYQAGLPIRTIAEEIGIDKAAIWRHLDSIGATTTPATAPVSD